jgi:hypothetical protein
VSEPGKNGKRGYSWAPFTKGNKRGVIHGARDEARVTELAEKYAADLLADPAMPGYLREPSFRAAIDGYARTAVIVDLLWAYIGDKDLEEALTDRRDTAEDEDRVYGGSGGGSPRTGRQRRTRRRTQSDHVASALSQLHRAEGRLMTLRGTLGLDPASLAGLGRSVTRPSPALTEAIEELARQMGDEEP